MTDGLPIVQFASALIYAQEGATRRSKQDAFEGDGDDRLDVYERVDSKKALWNTLNIQVLRTGELDKPCEVKYSLDIDRDPHNAKVVKKMFRYVDETSNTLKFDKHEKHASFSIVFLPGNDFDSVVEIPFKLEAKDGTCKVNEYLCRARVKVIDNDVFPSDKFKKELLDDPTCVKWKTGKDVQMVWEIIKLCFSLNKSGAIKILIGDTIANLIFIAQLKLFQELVETLSDENNNLSNAGGKVCWLAFALTMPFAFTHAFNYLKETWKVGGKVRKEMIKDLLVRILYYREASRDHVKETEVKETFGHHLFQVVSDIYMQSFVISAALGRIGLLLLYFSYNAINAMVEDNKDLSYLQFLPFFFAAPLAAILYTRSRQVKNRAVREKAEHSRMELSAFLAAVIDSFRAIADCHARPQVIANCVPKVDLMNAALVAQGKMQANDVAFFGWAKELVEGCIIIIGGFLVLRNYLSVGALLAAMNGLKDATAQYGVIFNAALRMQGSLPAMWLLCQYMNMPMDLEERMKMQERRHEVLTDGRNEEEPSSGGRRQEEGVFDDDNMSIRVKMEAGFEFWRPSQIEDESLPMPLTPLDVEGEDQEPPPEGGSMGDLVSQEVLGVATMQSSASVFTTVDLTIKQGSVVCITGHGGSGKRTLLKVLAGVLPLPRDSDIAFVPPHLRVHHLELQQTLYAALVPDGDKSESATTGYDNAVAYNVFFALIAQKGVNRISELTKEERAHGVKICNQLDMNPGLIEMVEKPIMGAWYKDKIGFDLKTLPQSSRIKIQLARALVADPEVLVVHQPTEGLHENDANLVSDLLVNFVKKSPISEERRPRTCIFSSNRPNVLCKAEVVYELKDGECKKMSDQELERRRLHAESAGNKALREEMQETDYLRAENSTLKDELESARAELGSAKAELESLRRELLVHQRV